jgi:trigger factor
MKVLEIKEKELPELNDDFAKDMGFDNLEELRKTFKESLENKETRRQNIAVEKTITQYLLDENVFEVPETLIIDQEKIMIDKMKSNFSNQGIEEEHINKQIEESKEIIRKEAENTVRLSYILNRIYTNEKIEVSEDDLESEKAKMKEANPTRESMVDKYFVENKDNIRLSIKESKLFKFLIDNSAMSEEIKDMPLEKEY